MANGALVQATKSAKVFFIILTIVAQGTSKHLLPKILHHNKTPCFTTVFVDSNLTTEQVGIVRRELEQIETPTTVASLKVFKELLEKESNLEKVTSRHEQHCDTIILYPHACNATLGILKPQTFQNMHVIVVKNYNWESENEFRPYIEQFQAEHTYIFVRDFDPEDMAKTSTVQNTISDEDTFIEFSSETHLANNYKKQSRLEASMDKLREKHFRVQMYDFKSHYFSYEGTKVGLGYNIINSASLKYNFTYELGLAGVSLTKLDDGTFTGFEFDLIYDRADILLLYTTSFLQNSKVVATSYFSAASVIFLTSIPSVIIDWQAIIYPLQGSTWAAIILCGLGVWAVLYLRLKFAPKRTHQHPLSTSFDIAFHSLLGQSLTVPNGVEAEDIPEDFSGLAQRT
ncbi:unnamed protein product, partial [Allacma fusca]